MPEALGRITKNSLPDLLAFSDVRPCCVFLTRRYLRQRRWGSELMHLQRRHTRRHLRVLLLFLLSLRSALALAQDAVKLTPKSYKILFENEKVRVTRRTPHSRRKRARAFPSLWRVCMLLMRRPHQINLPRRENERGFEEGGRHGLARSSHTCGENIGNTEIHELLIKPKSA